MKCYSPLILALTFMGLSLACQAPEESPAEPGAPAATQGELSAKAPADPSAAPTARATEAEPKANKVAKPNDPRLLLDTGERHQVFSLWDNRVLAHPIRKGGFATKLGAPEGAKYLWGGHPRDWILRRSFDEIPVAIPRGKGSPFVVPLTATQAREAKLAQLRFRNLAEAQEVTLVINGVEQSQVHSDLDRAWHSLEFALEPGSLRAGENEISVKFSSTGRLFKKRTGGALAHFALLPESLPQLDLAWATEEDAKRRALTLPADGGLAFYLMPKQGARLTGTLEAEADCRLVVQVAGVREERFDIDPAWGAAFSLDLGEFVDQVLRIELLASASEGGTCQEISLIDAGLSMPGTAAQMPQLKPPKNIVIWLIDTLRADHLKAYNPKTEVQTPNLDALAASGVVFERFYIHGNESKVSHASLFTGLYPIRHRHLSGSTRVSSKFELIPEAMKRAGLRTAAYLSNGYVSKGWGFRQGWDSWVNTIREHKANKAVALVKRAGRWFDRVKENPFFLYLGTIDPHVTYNRHKDFIGLYDEEDEKWRNTPYSWNLTGSQMELVLQGKLAKTEAERERIHDLYRNEISYNDYHFGRLIEDLEARGLRDETLILVVADHGDEFWEHGGAGHARSIYEELVRVPLIISYPPLFPPGTRVAEGAGGVDIHATLTAALGIERGDVQGQSLIPIANGRGQGYPRPAIATHKNVSYAMLLDDWKIILQRSGEYALYDLHHRTTEGEDVATTHPRESRWLLDALGLFLAYDQEWDKSRFGVASNLSPSFMTAIAALEERLR